MMLAVAVEDGAAAADVVPEGAPHAGTEKTDISTMRSVSFGMASAVALRSVGPQRAAPER
jgi:hypothetical protein